MFDMSAYGVSAEDYTAEILFNYYEYLREKVYTTRTMYWDVQADRETIYPVPGRFERGGIA